MKPRNPGIRSALAGEYVIGTLTGPASRRFERLLENDPSLMGEVEAWQSQLYRLVELLPERTPPVEVWEKLSRRVIPDESSAGGIWDSLFFWRAGAVLAGALAIVLAIGVGTEWKTPRPPDYHIVVSDEEQRAIWLVSTANEQQTVKVKTLADQTLEVEQSLELWLIVSADTPPISLGLIPESGSKSLPLSQTTLTRFADATALAVSLEPAGGSPTGLPTGPVLYQGAFSP